MGFASGKVFFGGCSEIPNSADLACRFVKPTPWDFNMVIMAR